MKTNLLRTNWQSLPEQTIRRLQAARLRHYLRTVVLPFSAHYRNLFVEHGLSADSIRTLEDLQRVPFTAKADLLNTPEHPERVKEFVLIPDQTQLARRFSTLARALVRGRQRVKAELETEFRPLFLTATTGRSSEPVPFLYTQHDLDNLALAGRRLFGVCGAEKDLRLLNMFPYAPHLAFWQTHYGGTAFGVFVLSSGGGKVLGTEGQLRLIRQIKPHVLIGMPTFVYHVMRQSAEEGVCCPTLCRIVLGGEKVAEGMRRKLVKLASDLGANRIDVVSTYGFTEAKMAWAECPRPVEEKPSGFHLYPDLGIVEIIDPKTGEVVPDGQPGEIVFTPLDARGSVVLRYRTSDLIDGGLVYDPCPACGRRAPRLVGNISRSSEIKEMRLEKLKGTLVDFNELEHALDDAEHVGAWQLEIRKRNNDPLDLDELILHVQQPDGLDRAKFVSDLTERFAARTEVRPNRIVFHETDEMTRLLGIGAQLKEQKIVDRRPGAPAGRALPGRALSPTAPAEESADVPTNAGLIK